MQETRTRRDEGETGAGPEGRSGRITASRLTALRFLPPLLLLGAVVLAFLPSLSNGFVGWDDGPTIVDNPSFRGLGPERLRWMFTTFHMGHYQPLSWVSLALDYLMWGLDPRGYHLTSLLLHAANVLLLYGLIRLLLLVPGGGDGDGPGLRWAAAGGALLFAIHPLRVESVAWATERRDVLSGFFFLLAVTAYLAWRGEGEGRRLRWYLLALAAMVLSLMSKAIGITLPVVLLILDAWPLQRLSFGKRSWGGWWKIVAEKVPFILVSVLFALVATMALAETTHATLDAHPLPHRVAQALYGISFYLFKTVVPVRLSPLYLLPADFDPWRPLILAGAGAALFLTGILVGLRRRRPTLLAAWCAFIVLVSPVLGLAQAGPQIAADRYTYLPHMPFAVVVAAGLLGLFSRLSGTPGRKAFKAGLAAAFAALSLFVGILTYRQCAFWKDSLTLWNHAVGMDPANYIARKNRGTALQERGHVEAAVADYSAAIRANPAYAAAYRNRGAARFSMGDPSGALEDLDRAVSLAPSVPEGYFNRGLVRARTGDLRGAREDYTQAIDLDPEYAAAWNNRGSVRRKSGDLAGARSDFDEALRLDPNDARARNNRGVLLREEGRHREALADFDQAIRLDPSYGIALLNRGITEEAMGLEGEALEDYRRALEVASPGWPHEGLVLERIRALEGETALP